MNLFFYKIGSLAWQILLFLGATYAGILVLLHFLQPHFIYFPQRKIIANPGDIGLHYEKIFFEALDGVRLSGWFVPHVANRAVILFCHGNGGNISSLIESVRTLHKLGLSTFVFDYRGFGESQGKTTEPGTYADIEGAWNYLIYQRGIKPYEIIVLGRSLGGAIAAWLVQKYTPKALILESTFTSAYDVAAQSYPFLPLKLFMKFHYNTIDYLKKAKCPVLIIHSHNDELIPFRHGKKLFEAANNPKEFLEIKGPHSDGVLISAKIYSEGLDRFIDKQLNNEYLSN